MQFMILRKADRHSEAGNAAGLRLTEEVRQYRQQLAAAGVLRGGADLMPGAGGVRMHVRLAERQDSLLPGPFPEAELVDSFTIIEAPTREAALDWMLRWPAADGEAALELRETGCPGGCAEVVADQAAPQARLPRFAILLRSDRELESGVPPPQARLDTLDRSNAAEAKAGVLLAADGLQPSAKGARVKFSGGKPTVIDGPFTEIKEMIAGYWLIRAASMDAALEWARRNPYPCGSECVVEIRQVREAA